MNKALFAFDNVSISYKNVTKFTIFLREKCHETGAKLNVDFIELILKKSSNFKTITYT